MNNAILLGRLLLLSAGVRALGGTAVFCTIVCVAANLAFLKSAFALPFEDFASLSRRTYRVYGDVEETYRGSTSIGSILTIEVPYNPKGDRLQFGGPGGEGFTATSTPVAPLFLRLSWDGESAPRVISGAGLGCIDLTAEKATAFILSDFRFLQTCPEKGYECPFVEVQIKIFDGSDPTGQRYSSGVVRRRVADKNRDLMIPFSQLVREGPEGPWKPSCVGAVSLTILGVPEVPTTVFMKSFSTNGNCREPLKNGRPTCPQVSGARQRADYGTIYPDATVVESSSSPSAEATVAVGTLGTPATTSETGTPIPVRSPPPAPPIPESAKDPIQQKSDLDEMFDDIPEDIPESVQIDSPELPVKEESAPKKTRINPQRVFGKVSGR